MWFLAQALAVSPVPQHQTKRRQAHQREAERCFSMTPVSLESDPLAFHLSDALWAQVFHSRDGADRRECHRTAEHLCSSQRSLLSNSSLASVTSRLRFPRSYRSGTGRVSKLPQVLFETESSCQWREPLLPVVGWGFKISLGMMLCSCGSVVEHCVSSTKGCGFDSQRRHILKNNCIAWMHCKSLWIKASAKCKM